MVPRTSRRVCAVARAALGPTSESFAQRVYQPFLTTCDGHRACSTYRTIYRTAYRHGPVLAPARPRFACCPGWKRTGGLPGACATAICQPPCGNGGSCVWPGRCHCPAGWQGNTCHKDVDECSSGGAGCPQGCVNTVGSYWCQCWEGHSPSADGMSCLPTAGPPRVAPNAVTEAAAGAGPSARPGLTGPRARAAGPRQPPGPFLAAAGPHRLSERADLLPGGAAGVLLLQGAVTALSHAQGWTEPTSPASSARPMPLLSLPLRGLLGVQQARVGPCQALQGLGEGTRASCPCWDVGVIGSYPRWGGPVPIRINARLEARCQ
ncbi:PREDICTED: epidermal growth factor-like protein 7 isoform X3 [Chinchilla lanigera]|uniref:epidermal growth factor-like protein 7 isoform X3 n=1 Tax=Chinchilla lanigera TaxID=34839 RepID=UPI000698156B|nr:PREDICTED: epidermal growth factor-like protein 7 isoform X3 [Chinchilla lanigera]